MINTEVDVDFPILSTDEPDSEGVVSTWYAHHDEIVTAGQVIAEVQVDKVSADIEAPVDGLIQILVQEESVVRQGTVIARIRPI